MSVLFKRSFLVALAVICFFSITPPGWSMAKRPAGRAIESIPVSSPPLSLTDCFALALKQSETLAIKGVQIEKSWSDFLSASDEALGDINFIMTDSFQDPQKTLTSSSTTSNSGRYETREKRFVITQPIFQGFKALGAISGAGSLRQSRVFDRKRAEHLLFLEVASAFYSRNRYARELEIKKGILKLLEERVKELSDWEKIGKSRPSEVVTAKSRTNNLEADLAETQGAWIIQTRVLEFLTGTSLEERLLEDSDVPTQDQLPLGDLLKNLGERADVASSLESLKTSKRNIVIAQSRLWPAVSFENNLYEQREGSQAGTSWDALVKVDVPLFQGGGAIGEIVAARSDYKTAKLTYEKTRREAELDLKKTYASWNTAQKRFQALEEAVKTSEENYRLQKEDYEKNLVSNLDVLQALESLNETRTKYNQIHYELKEDYWALQVARGNCCEFI